MPHLLDIQTRAFEALLQLDAASHDREDIGLERVFKDLFPITDVHENFSLEFVRYSLGEPKYSVEECIERDMTYSAPLKATLQLGHQRGRQRAEAPAQHHRERSLSRRAAAAHAARHLRHQRRRTRHRQPAAPVAGRGVRRVDAPERPAPHLGAHHSVPRIVGRVHRRHPRRDLRPHRQEEEVPGHRAPPRLRLREQLGHPPPLLRRPRARPHQEAREPHRPRAKCSARSSPKTSRSPGEATAEDAPKARTKKAKAERERAENDAAREGRRRAHRGGVQPPPPAEHRRGQGLRSLHARSTCATSRTRSSAASARCRRRLARRRRRRRTAK